MYAMTTTTQTIVDPPTLSGFTTHYGIPVAGIGEDGDLAALGRHDPRRAFAAFRRFVRREWGWDLAAEMRGPRSLDERVRHELWVVTDRCGECGDDPDCSYCSDIRTCPWWLREATPADRTAFYVTTWT